MLLAKGQPTRQHVTETFGSFREEGATETVLYLNSLRDRMNAPNPLDVDYLDKSRSAFEQQKLGDSVQLEDIPDVYRRLYEDGLRKKRRQDESVQAFLENSSQPFK